MTKTQKRKLPEQIVAVQGYNRNYATRLLRCGYRVQTLTEQVEMQGAGNFGVSLAANRDDDGIPDSYEEANGLNPAVDDGERARLNYLVASGTLVPEPGCVWVVLLVLRRLRASPAPWQAAA